MSDHSNPDDVGNTPPEDASHDLTQPSDDPYSGHHDHRPGEPSHRSRSDDPYSGHHDHRPGEPSHPDPSDDPYSGHHDHSH